MDIVREAGEMYRGRLSLPPMLSGAQFFICPMGPPGAGKSAIMEPLAAHYHMAIISSAGVRAVLKDIGVDFRSVHEVVAYVANALAHQGYRIAFDMDCSQAETQQMIRRVARGVGARAVFIKITAPESVQYQRFRMKPPRWFTWSARRTPETIAQDAHTHTHEVHFACTIDTADRLSLERQIAECTKKIDAHLAHAE